MKPHKRPPTAPLPTLATRGHKPSWHNRAGRIDRSACLCLSVSRLWRRLPEDAWHHQRTTDALRKRRPDRLGHIELCAHDLWIFHRFEPPQPLQGDGRSSKSNAMRVGFRNSGLGVRDKAIKAEHPPNPNPQIPNPNRGVGFSMGCKILGLPADWGTALTIERYVQHAKLRQHFLVCPACGSLEDQKTPAERSSAAMARARPNPQSPTPKSLPAKLPPGRVTKLYLPLCTRREWEDAQVAWLWLKTHRRPNAPLSPEAMGLLDRYGELFPGRQLRCRACLGLRYGEVKG